MANTLDKITTFLRVSPMQQVVSLGMSAPMTVFSTYGAIEGYSNGNVGMGVANTLSALANLGCFLFNESLAIKKMEEYGDLRNALEKYSWDERIIEPKSHSWCQRNMAQVASEDSGFGEETKKYLHEKGYRWYHFIPDKR